MNPIQSTPQKPRKRPYKARGGQFDGFPKKVVPRPDYILKICQKCIDISKNRRII